ncbi:MAG: tagatose-6-phosphate kinase [Planctomycetota bacterium]
MNETIDLRAYCRAANHPVMCIGPMSRNIVDAVVCYADRLRQPIPLIASRRQIDAASLGGGYVENWTTESFAAFVRSRGGTFAPMCRDHGGPWQGTDESDLPVETAMDRAKASIAEDLARGFRVIHLDPSIGEETRSQDETLNLLFDLYEFTISTARELNRPVELEVGTEQQSGDVAGAAELIAFLKAVTQFCRRERFPHPLFCVVQTGTLVREMRNVGLTEGRRNEEVDQRYAVSTMAKNVRMLTDVAYINDVFVKEHNGDYLSDGSLAARAEWEIGGVNIAPEMGVFETKTMISLCQELGRSDVRDGMLELFHASRKWDKWMRAETTATDVDRAIIAGHYCFADDRFLALKHDLVAAAAARGIDVDATIREGLTAMLRRMTWCLGYQKAACHAIATPDIQINRTTTSPVPAMHGAA